MEKYWQINIFSDSICSNMSDKILLCVTCVIWKDCGLNPVPTFLPFPASMTIFGVIKDKDILPHFPACPQNVQKTMHL